MMTKLRKTGSFHAQADVGGDTSRGSCFGSNRDDRCSCSWLLSGGGCPNKKCTRVLIIDDNVDAADSMRDLFLLTHAEVEVAYDGRTGIAKAKRFRPDLVMCDIGLPGMDGYEVVRALRQAPSLSNSRILAWTGYARSEDIRRCAQAGFHGFLAKPLSTDQLSQLLHLAGPA